MNTGEFVAWINYTRLFSQAPTPIAILRGREMRYVFINDAYAQIFSKRQILGKTMRDAFPELEGQPFSSILEEVFDTGIPFNGNEIPVLIDVNSDGLLTTRYFNLVYTPYTDNDGRIEGVMAFGNDVTEQVEARHKVEYAEESARLAIESADLGTYEVNLLTNEMFTSPRFNAIWGLDHITTNRAEFVAVIHPDDMPVREQAHIEAVKNGNLQYEARIRSSAGGQRWVRVKGRLLYDKQGTPTRLLGMIQDITEQKQFAEELSKKVEERTKALKEVNEMLERSNEDLEQFAFVASHDLQEPLRKIQLFNNYVMEQPGMKEESIKYMEKVNEATGRMKGLIRDLLEYSRLSHKRLLFEKTDLNVIVKNVLTDFELLITQKQAIIQTDVLPVIEAIPLQMNQLFFNLIGNALKFAKRNTAPVINISARKFSGESRKDFLEFKPDRDYCEVRISDNGIGFDQEYADKIFTIFQRLNERSLYGGYGIGLALCRKIVGNHSGVIYAEGTSSEGAAFIFILPCTQDR